MSIISASTTSTTAYKVTADTTGKLDFQTGSTPTTYMTLDASGNLGVGTSSPNVRTEVGGTDAIVALRVNTQNSGVGSGNYSEFQLSDVGSVRSYWRNMRDGSGATILSYNDHLRLSALGVEKVRIDSSGNLLVGTTSTGNSNSKSFVANVASGFIVVNHLSGQGSGSGYASFGYNASEIGSITQNGTTGVLYNLTSDYRLKNDPQPLTGAKDFVMALQPKKWQWWDGSGEGVGFIAHEFMEVAKYSGNGEKDAVDENGNPVYQSIQPSSSEVMANLVALLQEQQAIIETLTNRITALEAK